MYIELKIHPMCSHYVLHVETQERKVARKVVDGALEAQVTNPSVNRM